MTSRSRQIYLKGAEVYEKTKATGDARILQAVAVMLAEATKPKTAKKTVGPSLPFSPQELYELCLERVPHIIACEPYSAQWFGRLGKSLQGIGGLVRDDMEHLVCWIESGGLDFGDSWTFGHVVKHINGWIPKARSAMGESGGFKGAIE